MSVQRWKPSWAQGRMIPAGVHPVDGYVSAADHARVVAEMERAHAAALADANLRWDAEVTRALDEGEKIGRADAEQAHAAALAAERKSAGAGQALADEGRIVADNFAAGLRAAERALAPQLHSAYVGEAAIRHDDHARIVAGVEARWVEIARQDRMAAHQRGAQEAERQHAKALADMEQAHAAALAAAVAAARAAVVTVELVGDYATGYNAGLIEGDAKGRREGKRLAEAAAAPRTLTAADPEPGVGAVVLLAVGNEAVQRSALGWQGYAMHTMQWAEMFRFGPVTLIHDGEDR